MGIPSSSASFGDRVDALLSAIEDAVDALSESIDVDVERAGNVLTLTFESGQKLVVNSQTANQEVWVAARSGGFHYRWDETIDRWTDTRSGEDLEAALARITEGETGVALVI